MRVCREFYFDASHYLPGYKGKCEQFHGHTYRLEVSVEGPIGDDGMVLDFNELKEVVNTTVLEKLDHRNLNDLFKNPTAENIASWIFTELGKKMSVRSVKLWEGHGKWVEVTSEENR
ncbi:MAG: 6-carboxytetrahydropterin synthase QueD [Candidatus Altiarchaeota archaeon]|nr:6-carboxytetrahydropterin synthase QueD [Candidatus Altiarchaeota archaeon]